MSRGTFALPVWALGLCAALLLFSSPGQATDCPVGAAATCLTGQGNWTSTLQERSFDGGATIGGYYDAALNVTWLANANVLGTTPTWDAATSWASTLTVGSVGGWRLPTMTDVGNDGCAAFSFAGGTDCGYNVLTGSSELAHMFYVTLGDRSFCPPGDTFCAGSPQPGWGLTNTGPFSNLMDSYYWTNLAYAGQVQDPSAWVFRFTDGTQYFDCQCDYVTMYAWAVHDGDVGEETVVPVPLPASVWLLLCGLFGLAAVKPATSRQNARC